jgi:hypothetical protein
VKELWYAQFSFNKTTFTSPTKICNLRKMSEIKSESERFKFSINEKLTVLRHSTIYLRAPFLIMNCLAKGIKFQFVSYDKQISTKEIKSQEVHEVFANEVFENLKFKISTEGFYWSDEISMDAREVGKEQSLRVKGRGKGGETTLRFIFERDSEKHQIRLSIYCPAFVTLELEEDVLIYGSERVNGIETFNLLEGQD